jgi:hypothetical protein
MFFTTFESSLLFNIALIRQATAAPDSFSRRIDNCFVGANLSDHFLSKQNPLNENSVEWQHFQGQVDVRAIFAILLVIPRELHHHILFYFT